MSTKYSAPTSSETTIYRRILNLRAAGNLHRHSDIGASALKQLFVLLGSTENKQHIKQRHHTCYTKHAACFCFFILITEPFFSSSTALSKGFLTDFLNTVISRSQLNYPVISGKQALSSWLHINYRVIPRCTLCCFTQTEAHVRFPCL